MTPADKLTEVRWNRAESDRAHWNARHPDVVAFLSDLTEVTQRHGFRIVNTVAGAYLETLTPETAAGHYEAGFDRGDLVLIWETETAPEPVHLSDMTDEEIISFFDGDALPRG